MTDRVIACANCGAKYKIPESFKGAKARCKACGSTIEFGAGATPPAPVKPAAAPVAAARPAAQPAAPRAEATARVAAARGSTPATGGRREAGARTARAGAAGRHRAGGERDVAHGRGRAGRRGAEPTEKSKTPLLIGIGVLVIAGGAGAFLMMRGGDDKPVVNPNQQQAAVPAVAPKQEPAAKPTEPPKPAEAAAKKESGTAEPATAQKQPEKPAEQPAEKPAEQPAAKDPAKEPAKKEPKKPAPTKPFDAKAELQDLAFPSDVTEAEKTELSALATTAIEDSSIHGQRALKKLEAGGRKAMPAILNKLRSLDYLNPGQVDSAFSLHQTIEKILLGNNVDFRPRDPMKDAISQEEAWHNAAQLKPLWRFWQTQVGNGELEPWDKWVALRKENLAKKKPAEEDKLPDLDK